MGGGRTSELPQKNCGCFDLYSIVVRNRHCLVETGHILSIQSRSAGHPADLSPTSRLQLSSS